MSFKTLELMKRDVIEQAELAELEEIMKAVNTEARAEGIREQLLSAWDKQHQPKLKVVEGTE